MRNLLPLPCVQAAARVTAAAPPSDVPPELRRHCDGWVRFSFSVSWHVARIRALRRS